MYELQNGYCDTVIIILFIFRRSRSRSFSPDSSDFGNSPIKVTVGSPVGRRDRSRTPSPSRSPARAPEGFYLAIKNLSRNVNEGHLKEIFGVYGKISAVSYPMHPNTGYPAGNAVIEYSDSNSLADALKGMNGGQIDGNVIECYASKYSQPQVRVPGSREVRRDVRVGDRRGLSGNFNGRRNRSRTPPRRRSRSPFRPRRDRPISPSSKRRFSRSPARRLPMRRPISPMRRPVSRSPMRRPISRTPPRRASRSRSPIRRPIRSPRGRALSRSRSPMRRLSRSPIRRFSRSRSPFNRRPKSISRSRSPPRFRREGPMNRNRSPRRFDNSRSPKHLSLNRSPGRFSPDRSPRRLSPNRFPNSRRSPSRSPIPVSRMKY